MSHLSGTSALSDVTQRGSASPGDVAALIAEVRGDPGLRAVTAAWRSTPRRLAEYGAWPESLDGRLAAMLRDLDMPRLYSHQAKAIEHTLSGENVIVVTPTASGKSLCYVLPILDALLHDPQARALLVFPTKALAHDQVTRLRSYVAMLGLDTPVEAYDGDTPSHRRSAVRKRARILVTNPDMLQVGILPSHPQWREFWPGLRHVVVDELHSYRGVFGSHVGNVLRRLARVCRFYGSDPRHVCCSATIANPQQLAERLFEAPFHVVDRNGAPSGERQWWFVNPPLVDEKLGLRQSALDLALSLAQRALDHDIQTVLFCGSRLAVEQAILALAPVAGRLELPDTAVRGYRGGYLPSERRAIELGLRQGTVRLVAATTALELGVDIGGLDVCIMAGYPGSVASTRQQSGRAGRADRPSLTVLVAGSSPLDQYVVRHPTYVMGRSPEHALVDPDNLYLLLQHLPCAAFEVPLADGETFGARVSAQDTSEILSFLEEQGALRSTGGRWYWSGEGYPAQALSLRSADGASVRIVCQDAASRRTIGTIDRSSAPLFLHPGAIYMHGGAQYAVTSLDLDLGLATVTPVRVDHMTRASESTTINVERVIEETAHGALELSHGEVTLTSKVTSYRTLRLRTLEYLARDALDLPEQTLLTMATWLTISPKVVDRLRDLGWWAGDHVHDRGPNWAQQRRRARRRDGYRCQQCGAPEVPGRQHHVHHVQPFREFGWLPGENDAYRAANTLGNLITLCPNCHRRVEQQVAVQGTLSGLARVIGHILPLLLMCDAHDLRILSDAEAPQTGRATIFCCDAIAGGIGLSYELLHIHETVLCRARELVADCGCATGCPSCIGPGLVPDREAKRRVLALIDALTRGLTPPIPAVSPGQASGGIMPSG